MGIQARQIVRHARKHGITLKRGAVNDRHDGKLFACAKHTAGHLAVGYLIHDGNLPLTRYVSEIASKFGISENDIGSFEAGFEGWKIQNGDSQRYYKVGQNIARLAGLSGA